MVEKLGSITNATNATIGAIKALAAALASAKTFTAPTVTVPTKPTTITPITPTYTVPPLSQRGARVDVDTPNISITQNILYPTASASEISAQTLGAIKFGTSGGYTPSYATVGSRDR